MVVDDADDACLNELLGAHEARVSRQVCSSSLGALSASLYHCVVLSEDANALLEVLAVTGEIITTSTSTLVAILDSERSTIEACCYDSIVLNDYTPYCPLHTVGALRDQMSQLKEIAVPGWPNHAKIGKVVTCQGCIMELLFSCKIIKEGLNDLNRLITRSLSLLRRALLHEL